MEEKKAPGDGQAAPESSSFKVVSGSEVIIASDGTPEVVTAEAQEATETVPVVEAGTAEVIASDGAEETIAAAAVEPEAVTVESATVTVEDAPGAGQPPAPTSAPVAGAGASVPPSGTSATPVPPAPPAPVAGAGQPSPTAALVCGILAIVFSWLPLIGVVLGIVAIVLAGKYFKAGGAAGSGKAGRICGIVGIAFSLLCFILYIVTGCMAVNLVNEYYGTSGSTSSSLPAAVVDEEDEAAAAREAVEMRLDQIKDRDPQMMATLATMASDSFESAFGGNGYDMTMENCGVDPNEFVSLMTEGFDYTFDELSEIGSTTSIDYYLTVRDIRDVVANFNEAFEAADDAGEFDAMSDDQVRQRFGELLMNAVRDAEMTTHGLFDVDLEEEGGIWVIDEDDWNDELTYFFTLE